jgi:hypothetical protein
MTRRLGIFLAAFAVLALLAFGAGATTAVRADGVATVSPVSGGVNDTFTFTVTGLTPGNTVRIQITDAAGTTYQVHDSSGSPLVLVVQDDGSVTDTLTPASDTPDAAPGDWTASFEEVETGASATIGFSVSS